GVLTVCVDALAEGCEVGNFVGFLDNLGVRSHTAATPIEYVTRHSLGGVQYFLKNPPPPVWCQQPSARPTFRWRNTGLDPRSRTDLCALQHLPTQKHPTCLRSR